jgi:hypothetical protein
MESRLNNRGGKETGIFFKIPYTGKRHSFTSSPKSSPNMKNNPYSNLLIDKLPKMLKKKPPFILTSL